ncbi:MAG: lipopolysaccharide transport periplasmic protein LptA [Thiobacillus sp.]|jgi:lipopolysaccharide export system protein LptA|uniref:lipopolysaccharide transport periplasmic protein LptA n=1 Tax=Thiobacillus sp. TaxID=924 RepID=UPI002894A356|nr:lipopolysaccharide transport periplasmic protein LptA [Thiobacillus sp.]MDT3708050.1 lipopolysaccharide transport periplasmic protein LptA [Thiobacillus sp.]
MRTLKTACLSALCAVLLASPAFAEKADRDKPINLEADTVTLDDIRKVSVYEGNVVLSQGTLMLRADRLQVTQNESGLDKLVATGRPVSFRQKLDGRDEFIEGHANRIEYTGTNNQLELIGQARLRRDGDELRGAQISYNANTEFYKVVGQPDAQTPGGRVRAVIRPKPRAEQPAAQP